MTVARRRDDLVRGYVLTGGRARGRITLDVAALVKAAPGQATPGGVQAEQQRALRLCRDGWLSVAEIAVHLGLPLSITRVLMSDLIDSGHLVTRADVTPLPPMTTDRRAAPGGFSIPDHATLERLLHGLQAL